MEYVSLGRIAAAFLLVLGLMLGLAWLLRKAGIEKRLLARGKPFTLAVEETIFLDPRRKVVIVSRERKRYVLLLGQGQDILLETYEKGASPETMPE